MPPKSKKKSAPKRSNNVLQLQGGTNNRAKAKRAPVAPAPPKETYPPFSLVLYEIEKRKGVVETLSIAKKDRVKGAPCLALNPVDYSPIPLPIENRNKTKHKAFVIEFGCKNLNFILNFNLTLKM